MFVLNCPSPVLSMVLNGGRTRRTQSDCSPVSVFMPPIFHLPLFCILADTQFLVMPCLISPTRFTRFSFYGCSCWWLATFCTPAVPFSFLTHHCRRPPCVSGLFFDGRNCWANGLVFQVMQQLINQWWSMASVNLPCKEPPGAMFSHPNLLLSS